MTEASHSSSPSADEQRMPTSKEVRNLADRRLNEASEEYSHHQVKNRVSQVSGKSTPKCCVIAQMLYHAAWLEVCPQTASGYLTTLQPLWKTLVVSRSLYDPAVPFSGSPLMHLLCLKPVLQSQIFAPGSRLKLGSTHLRNHRINTNTLRCFHPWE